MRPANWSAFVLNTKANSSLSSSGSRVTSGSSSAPCFTGLGRSSTIASSSRLVPRFLVATPHTTGKIPPWLVPSFSAVTISSWEISSPSR